MNEPHSPSTPPSLRDQVSAAASAIQHDAQQAAAQEPPPREADRRPLAVLTLIAFAVTLWTNLDALRGRPLDEDLLIDGDVQSIEFARGVVQAHWDSTGTLPASLVDIGLGDYPFAYTATAQDFRIAARGAHGAALGYQSPTLPPRLEARR